MSVKTAVAVPRKSFGLGSIEIKDATQGLIQAKFATFNVVDLDGDWTLPTAFEAGAKVKMSAFGHTSWRGQLPIGKGVIRLEKDFAFFDGQFFMNTVSGRESFETVKAMGDLQEFSYGYDVLQEGQLTDELKLKGARRVLAKQLVHEISPVLVGAGGEGRTGLLSVKEAEISDAAEKETGTDARRELVKFLKTRARLAS